MFYRMIHNFYYNYPFGALCCTASMSTFSRMFSPKPGSCHSTPKRLKTCASPQSSVSATSSSVSRSLSGIADTPTPTPALRLNLDEAANSSNFNTSVITMLSSVHDVVNQLQGSVTALQADVALLNKKINGEDETTACKRQIKEHKCKITQIIEEQMASVGNLKGFDEMLNPSSVSTSRKDLIAELKELFPPQLANTDCMVVLAFLASFCPNVHVLLNPFQVKLLRKRITDTFSNARGKLKQLVISVALTACDIAEKVCCLYVVVCPTFK